MSEEMVKIKGGRSGLSLTFAPQASFEDILQHLQEKLESGSGFFLRGTMVFLPRDVLKSCRSSSMSMALSAGCSRWRGKILWSSSPKRSRRLYLPKASPRQKLLRILILRKCWW